jgi:hypothetical protein
VSQTCPPTRCAHLHCNEHVVPAQVSGTAALRRSQWRALPGETHAKQRIERSLWTALHHVNIYGLTFAFQCELALFQLFEIRIGDISFLADQNLSDGG